VLQAMAKLPIRAVVDIYGRRSTHARAVPSVNAIRRVSRYASHQLADVDDCRCLDHVVKRCPISTPIKCSSETSCARDVSSAPLYDVDSG